MTIDEVLAHYDLGAARDTEKLGGTAGATLRVVTREGTSVLRRRGERTSGLDRAAFDASLRRFLRARGLPTVAPVLTRQGREGVPAENGLWELTPLVDGVPYRVGDRRQLVCLARTLADLHRAGMEFRASGSQQPLHEQFRLTVPGIPASARIDDPARMGAALAAVMPHLADAERGIARRMVDLVGMIVEHYDGDLYAAIDRHLVHGDLHSSNLLFDGEGGVAGLFDFDWAAFAPRVRDLADGTWFFAGSPLVDGSDIWALTGARRVDPALARLFLREYSAAFPVTAAETRALPWARLARWIAIHLEGMYKVPPAERGRFLTRDMGETVEEMLCMDGVDALSPGPA
jgi:Ser/Thr protein kinase RdoA (MazF antagonist)